MIVNNKLINRKFICLPMLSLFAFHDPVSSAKESDFYRPWMLAHYITIYFWRVGKLLLACVRAQMLCLSSMTVYMCTCRMYSHVVCLCRMYSHVVRNVVCTVMSCVHVQSCRVYSHVICTVMSCVQSCRA
jgi:hypothetical protein